VSPRIPEYLTLADLHEIIGPIPDGWSVTRVELSGPWGTSEGYERVRAEVRFEAPRFADSTFAKGQEVELRLVVPVPGALNPGEVPSASPRFRWRANRTHPDAPQGLHATPWEALAACFAWEQEEWAVRSNRALTLRETLVFTHKPDPEGAA
jgi:hypothetical protein